MPAGTKLEFGEGTLTVTSPEGVAVVFTSAPAAEPVTVVELDAKLSDGSVVSAPVSHA